MLNRAFLRLPRRADQSDRRKLVETFVDVGSLLTLLSSPDHQIVYGRRGTGKTHALLYLADEMRRRGDLAVYVDMRTIGSTGGIYNDPSLPMTERGTRLLLDALGAIHDPLVDQALTLDDEVGDFTQGLTLLDRLAAEIAKSVRVVGVVRTEDAERNAVATGSGSNAALAISATPSLTLGVGDTANQEHSFERRTQRQGVEQHRIHFGAVSGVMRDVVPALGARRLWILIDEWSSIPLDLQPLLADLIRRALLPVPGLTVKIGAIEQRSEFRVELPHGDHLGIEVGADAAADINLDDFMVFGNDAEKAKEFFQNLVFKHVVAALAEEGLLDEAPSSPQSLVQRAFTQRSAFDEFVRTRRRVYRGTPSTSSSSLQPERATT